MTEGGNSFPVSLSNPPFLKGESKGTGFPFKAGMTEIGGRGSVEGRTLAIVLNLLKQGYPYKWNGRE